MAQREFQRSCLSCNSQIFIAASEMQDYLDHSSGGSGGDIKVICPHCGQESPINDPAWSDRVPYAKNHHDFSRDGITSAEGGLMAIDMSEKFKIRAYDIVSLLFLASVMLFLLTH